MHITIPTLLTLVRLALTPVIVYMILHNYWGLTALLYIIAALTDVLDGALARRWNMQTKLGACLDPVADKILLLASFITLAYSNSPLFTIPTWFILFVLIKEITVLAGVTFLLFTEKPIAINPTRLGKMSTVAQVCFIIWLCTGYFFNWTQTTHTHTLFIMLFTLIGASFVQYLFIGWKQYHASFLNKGNR